MISFNFQEIIGGLPDCSEWKERELISRASWPFKIMEIGAGSSYSRDEDDDRANAAMKYVHTYMQGNDRKFTCRTHNTESGERILVITRIS